jgi:hypothetical protein
MRPSLPTPEDQDNPSASTDFNRHHAVRSPTLARRPTATGKIDHGIDPDVAGFRWWMRSPLAASMLRVGR